jgi:hypothetical protein
MHFLFLDTTINNAIKAIIEKKIKNIEFSVNSILTKEYA